ncbi:MAG: response regulator, partial [Planctomycetota bacterium]
MKTVYFVHDRQENPAHRQQTLEMAGYRVIEFSNGEAAFEACQEEVPSVLVMDILIEGANGFDMARQFRAQYKPQELPILLTSKIYRGRLYREEARAAGAQSFLLRPLDLDEFLHEVGTLCGEL